MSFSPDGHWLAAASADGTVVVWDAATRTRWATLAGPVTGPLTGPADPSQSSGFAARAAGTAWSRE
jgi:WD40 repeat protein